MRTLLVTIVLFVFSAKIVAAQDDGPAFLVADRVYLQGDETLVAEGAVEVLRDGSRLTASRIIYNQSDESLVIDGPIRITQPDGTVFLSDAAELDAGFRNGILRGARVVLDEQLQLAAIEARRAEGRYTQLSKVAVTSCQICGQNEAPLWQIRASRIVHDDLEKQLYFWDAQLRVLDVPVMYLPRLRLPDPTLKRARGFLIPELQSSTLLGFGLKVPYFIPIGDHADLTLTPFVSTVTRTLEFRVRRSFVNGDIEINGAVSKDTIEPDGLRGSLFAEGQFNLARDYVLTFDVETASDPTYLSDYSQNDDDRLDSAVIIEKSTRDMYIGGALYHIESLREEEDNSTLPTIVADARYVRRIIPRFGGEFRVGAELHSHYRYSNLDVDGSDDDDVVDGRDVTRMALDVTWLNRWTLPGGLRAGVETALYADHVETRQDQSSDPSFTQITPAARAELRWPLTKTAADGARILLEPIAQVAWVGGERGQIANDESTRVEFDEGNLLSLSRFPAADRRERGGSAALGLRWLREDPRGWSAGLTLGRVWRNDPDSDFSRSSGLDGEASDWLISGDVHLENGLSFLARGLVNNSFGFSKAEALASWDKGRIALDASYLLLVSDDDEDRATALSEWNFAGSYDLNQNWTASASWRYDLAENQFAKASMGLDYTNECVAVGFSVSRRFESSTNVEPSTNYGLTVALKGFSTGGSAKEYRRTCN